MELYWKAVAAVLLGVVLVLTLRRQELGLLLSMTVGMMVLMVAMTYLKPVLELLDTLKALGNLDGDLIAILMKGVGIGLVTEVAVLVCNDSGNGSMVKALQLLGTVVILWMSMPLFTALLELIQEMLKV